MNDTLDLLIIEDSESDAILVILELQKEGINPVWERVHTIASLEEMLTTRTWDAIIADYYVPGLDAPDALKLLNKHELDIPFIVVSGAIGERTAVEMMKAGAHDHLHKGNLNRLPEVVRREVREAQLRAEHRQAIVMLKQQLTAIEAASDGIAILQEGIYLFVNQAYVKLLGYQYPEELLGQHWGCSYAQEALEQFNREIFPVLKCELTWQGEAVAVRENGSTFTQGLSLTLTENDLMICVSRDISHYKKAQEEIAYHALHDPLTKLPNRSLFLDRLELVINKNKRNENYHYAVLFLDLDRFKIINDSLGHWYGDQLLISIAKRLQTYVRNIDLVARLGGDEFVILLEPIAGIEEVIHISERILENFQTPFMINGYEIFSSLSIGIALGKKGYEQAEDLLRDADIAMYRAKKQDHNSYQFFNPEMHAQILKNHRLEVELRKAIEKQELLLNYQPIFDLDNNKLMGFEALVRWQHPTRGLLLPDDFIPIAEETGLIVPLDSWVFKTACHQLALWKQRFPDYSYLTININLSAQDLVRSSLITQIDNVLAETGLEGHSITLEITESMLIEDIEQTIDLLGQIEARRIRISIDDFGTGYSSLKYLNRLPVNSLKIDRSFIHDIQTDQRNCQVVSTIITLSNQLELSALAEGIENQSQLQQLQDLGCHQGQGYLFAKPLLEQEIETQFLLPRQLVC